MTQTVTLECSWDADGSAIGCPRFDDTTESLRATLKTLQPAAPDPSVGSRITT